MPKYCRFKPPPTPVPLTATAVLFVIKSRVAWGLSGAWLWWLGFAAANALIPVIRTANGTHDKPRT